MSTASRPASPPGQKNGGSDVIMTASEVVKRYDNIVKSQEDRRLYRALVLTNGLKILLVSDNRTDKAAASLDVNVGYMSDPDELPGLAHLCGQMIMLGSETYPQANIYDKFLSDHGGSSKANTSPDHTTYHVDVLPEYLHKALDIFVQFFISPIFPEAAMSQQINAINSEYQKNLSSDTWRIQQLFKSTSLQSHPFHKSGTGNKETLETIPISKNICVREELLKFHHKWYSSNIMSLVVLGKQSLDDLEAIVSSLFSSVKNRSVIAPTWLERPFPQQLCCNKTFFIPVEDIKFLMMIFPIPDMKKYYKTAPGQYLSYLIEHQGPGSLLTALRSRNWSKSLEVNFEAARGFGFLEIQVELTDEGLPHIDDIIHLLFQYITLLRAKGPQRWAWEEQRDLKALQFRFKDVEDPRSMVENHVHLLQEFPMEDVLSANYLMTEWKPQLITDLLSLLTPENMRILITAKAYGDRCKMTDTWSGTKYFQEVINPCLLQEWNSLKVSEELHLPPPNEFIPTNLELVKCEENASEVVSPVIIKDTPLMRLWYKQDTEFLLPKAWITFDILSPLPHTDLLSCNMTLLWVYLLKESLQQLAYASRSAGIMWKIDYIEERISVTIEGYNDKQHVLVDKIMEHIVTFRADSKKFHIMKEDYIWVLNSMETESQDLTNYETALCLTELVWSRHQLLETVKDITPEMLNNFVSRMIRKVSIEGFIFGNFTKERAVQIGDLVEKKFDII